MRIMIQHISSFQDFNAFMMKKYKKFIDFDINRFPKSKDEEANVYLYRIEVLKSRRRKGIGTQFMKDLCSYADFERIHLRLTPIPLDDEIEQGRLNRFYRKFGFRKLPKCETMRRAPIRCCVGSVKAELV